MPRIDVRKLFGRGAEPGAGQEPAPADDEPCAATPAEVKSLLQRVQEQQLAVQRALGERELRRQRRETARRLVLGTIFDRLDALARLLRLNSSAIEPRLVLSLGGLLGRVGQLLEPQVRWHRGLLTSKRRPDPHHNFYRPAHREAAWELISELECALLEAGDDQYLKVCLEAERTREEKAEDSMRWSGLHDPEQLTDLQERLNQEQLPASEDRRELRSEVIELLARLYQWRSDADREHRAKENLRVVRLRWTCWIFALALVAAAVLFSFPLASSWWQRLVAVSLVVVPAILGGTLGSVRSLRTEELISRAGEQPRYRWAFIAQLLVSATFGLFILVLAGLDSLPAIQIPAPVPGQPPPQLLDNDQNYYTLILFSFLVGLSEPQTVNFAERLLTGGGPV